MPDLHHGDLTITSSAFDSGDAIPGKYANSGDDVPPPLSWSHVPGGSAELVLVVHDPDAPLVDGFTHWVVTGIDPASPGLSADDLAGGTVGLNSLGVDAYMGPAPPSGHGRHHYFFHLFAVDVATGLDADADRATVLDRIEGHIVEQARLVGTFEVD